jgi:hypothetical protein
LFIETEKCSETSCRLWSGAGGRKSLGSPSERLVREWFETRKANKFSNNPVGQSLVCRRFENGSPEAEARTLKRFTVTLSVEKLTLINCRKSSKSYERFKNGEALEVPNVPFPDVDGSADFDKGMD